MSEWKEVRLGDVCEFHYGKSLPAARRKKGNIPVYGSAGIIGYHNKSLINSKGIIIGRKGTIGKVYKSYKPFFPIDTVFYVVPDDENYNFEYMFYLLKSLKLDKLNEDSAVPGLNRNNAYNQQIKLPPLPIQKKIADILSVIDEKIETLQNINETLEEMAKTIFKSWFVDFDIVKAKASGKSDSEIAKEFGISEEIVRLFPSEFVESEIGKIPKGWEVAYLGEENFSEIISSGIKPFKREKTYLATADVDNTQIVNKNIKITYNNRPSRANMQPLYKSIWFAKMKDSKKLLMFDDYSDINNYILSTGFAGIKTTNLSHNFLWTFIMSDDFEKQKNNLANGAVQIAINNQNIKKIYFVKPTKNILQIFNKITLPLFKKIYFNTQQVQTLQELRDTLLPKLINGEIEVDELEIRGLE